MECELVRATWSLIDLDLWVTLNVGGVESVLAAHFNRDVADPRIQLIRPRGVCERESYVETEFLRAERSVCIEAVYQSSGINVRVLPREHQSSLVDTIAH